MANSLYAYTPLTSPIAASGDKETVTVEGSDGVSQRYGIPAVFSKSISEGGKYIGRGDLNALFNLVSQFQYYLQGGGFVTFDDDVASAIGGYASGAILFFNSGDDSCFVMSRKNDNSDNFVTNPALITSASGSSVSAFPWLQITPSINDVKNSVTNIRVVDALPSDMEQSCYYFVRGV